MSSSDRISGSYKLNTYGGDVTITSNNGIGDIRLYGNLIVVGTYSNVQSIDTLIADNIITLVANIGNVAPVLDAGIEVRRGTEPTVGLRWHEPIDRWQVTSDGTYWANIMVRVEDDPDPHLGGNLSTTGSYFSNTNWDIRSLSPHNIVLNPGWTGNAANAGIQIQHTISTLPAVANATVIGANVAAGGDTGVYVSNQKVTNQELITKRKALVFSLVL